MAVANLKLECHHGRAGFDEIFEAWSGLMGRVGRQSFYQHPYWFRAFLHAYPEAGDRFVFACVYRGPTLVGVFPTTSETDRNSGLVVVDLPFGGELYQADCIIDDSEDGDELYTIFRKSLGTITGRGWDMFRARDVLRDGHLGQAVLQKERIRQTVYTEKRCAEIPIGDYDAAIGNLKKKFRGNLNNARSKINRVGQAEFVVERSAEGVRRLFGEFVELEMSGWKGDTSNARKAYPQPSAIGLKKSKLDFYTHVIDQFAEAGCVEISNLLLDGRLIGAQVCLLLNETSYLMKVAYDEQAGKFSPGQLLMDFAYRRYAEDPQINTYNLITDYRWFEGWQPFYRDYVVIRDFNMTLRGTVAGVRSKFGARRRDFHSKQH